VSAPNWFTLGALFFGRFPGFYIALEAAKVGVGSSYMTLITVLLEAFKILVGEGVFLAQLLQVQVVDCAVLPRRTSFSPAVLALCSLQDIITMVIE